MLSVFDLAKMLGKTVGEIERDMTCDEFIGWQIWSNRRNAD